MKITDWCAPARVLARRGETMATLPYVTVDAFTSVKFGGNPAAVVIFPQEDLARALETRKEQAKAKNHEVKWTYGCMPARTALANKVGSPGRSANVAGKSFASGVRQAPPAPSRAAARGGREAASVSAPTRSPRRNAAASLTA